MAAKTEDFNCTKRKTSIEKTTNPYSSRLIVSLFNYIEVFLNTSLNYNKNKYNNELK